MRRPGTYVLVVTLGSDTVLDVGALGTVNLRAGTYCYVGSAMGGLDQRVSRHTSRDKSVRWHIDRLTLAADGVYAYESYPDPVPECTLARMACEGGMAPAVDGFGCSDCRCRTHLFRADPGLLSVLVSSAGLHPWGGYTHPGII